MSEQPEDRAPRLWTALLGSALVAGAVVLAGTYATNRYLVVPAIAERDALRTAENSAAARLAGLESDLAALEQQVEGLRETAGTLATQARFAEQALALLRQPGLVVAELAATDAQPGASARMFWHPESRRGYLHAGQLEPPAEGHLLVLWLFTADDRTVVAGLLVPDAAGEAALIVELPADAGSLVRVLVSDEEEVGDAPHGGELFAWSAGTS